MPDIIIWNPERSMNFIAKEYLASYIYTHVSHRNRPDEKTHYMIRVQLKKVTLNTPGKWPGLWYSTSESEEEAKQDLAQLKAELVLAGVIKEQEKEPSNRFDSVELQEVHSE